MMGREIRRVPSNWQHPKKDYPNHRLGRMEEGYQPLYDRDAQTAWEEWYTEYQEWLRTGFAEMLQEHPEYGDKADEPYRAFCGYRGSPPDPEYYRPRWAEGEATWYQVYETVSEGTPVTPPFATKEELVEYLVANGDFWDQKRRAEGVRNMDCGPWDRKAAEQFVNAGWAPPMIVINEPGKPVEIKSPRDGGL